MWTCENVSKCLFSTVADLLSFAGTASLGGESGGALTALLQVQSSGETKKVNIL